MKENEPGVGVQTPPRKSYNPFDSDDEDINGFVKSNVKGYDIKSLETNDDSLTFHLDNGDISWEEAILVHSPKLAQSITDDDTNVEEILFRKDSELFTDKTVTECELPELIVCYKDKGFHSIKDIGVDEGVRVHEKVSIKSSDIDQDLEKDAFVRDPNENSVKDSKLEHELLEIETNDLEKVDEFERDSSKKDSNSSSQSSDGEQIKTNGVVYGTRDHQLSEVDEQDHGMVETKENQVSDDEDNGEDNISLESMEESSTKPSVINETEVGPKSSECEIEETTYPQTSEFPASQESTAGGGNANVMSYNSKVSSGSIILDFNSSAISGKKELEEEDNSQHNEAPLEKPPEIQTMSRHDLGASSSSGGGGSSSSIAVLNMDKRVHGETSFSAGIAPISFMEPIPYSGSISLRSESSTGSTRSFAFPVLQAEWNSSPVRMSKGEQKHFQEHRGWFHSILCCRF